MAGVLDLLTQFIRNSPVIAFVKDLEGRYQHVSEAWLEAFHVKEEQIVGKTDHQLFDGEQADIFVKNDQEVLASGVANRRYEEVMVPPERRTFLSTKFPLVNEEGQRTGLAGFAIDVTDQQRTLRELQLQKRFLERTQAMALVAGWELDVATRNVTFTSEMFRLLEVEEGTLTLEQFIAMVVPEHRAQLMNARNEALTKGTSIHLEVTLVTKSERRIRLRINAVPDLVDGKVVRLTGAVQDVTAERVVEERLRHASRMDAVGQLAGGVAHDFNNMLGAIVSAAELLRLESLSTTTADLVTTILTAATQAAGLTRQLLLFSRKDSARRVPSDLHAVLADALSILQRTLGRQITLVVDRSATKTRMLADSGQLANAIINLAINARDAMPEGGTLTFRTSDDDDEHVRLEVLDTGVGMTPEVLSHIFDPFFTTKDRGRGTGLGLTTVDSAVRAHDGEISVRSTPGRGSVFVMRFPLLKGEVETEAPHATVTSKGGELVLVVDDEALVRDTMSRLLQHLGYRVLEARNGTEAISAIGTSPERPALMILDLMMPGISALETFRAARALIPELPVLFCSGFAPESLVASVKSAPRTARLDKPFSSHDLQAAVRSLLQGTV